MQYKYFILLIFISSCLSQSDRKILETAKDDKGRIVKQVTEGDDLGEGFYRRTVFYDSLGREIKKLEIQDNNKNVQTFEYSDSSTYEENYYDLGETSNYTDTNFSVNHKNLVYTSHVRLNAKGSFIYEFKKWFEPDSIWCKEFFYDSTGSLILGKKVRCK
jgi:hypothetical protein